MKIKRAIFGGALLFLGVGAIAQTPDVAITTELRLVFFQNNSRTALKSYDPMGRFSTITLSLSLENGLWVRASQRFSRFDSDATESLLDASFVEAPGLWRIGYLNLNFGSNNLIRDYGFGAEITSFLLIDNLPFTLSVTDTGEDRPSGVVARIGEKIGISIAKGKNFAAGGSSLNAIRDPEEATGRGTGYKLAYGIDGHYTLGPAKWNLEFVTLRDGVRVQDQDRDLFDASVKFQGTLDQSSFLIGYTQDFLSKKSFYRFEATIDIAEKVQLYGIYKQLNGRGGVGIGTVIKF